MCTEYEVQIKNWTGAMTTAKNEVFIGLWPKDFYLVGGIKIWCGSLLGGNEQAFG